MRSIRIPVPLLGDEALDACKRLVTVMLRKRQMGNSMRKETCTPEDVLALKLLQIASAPKHLTLTCEDRNNDPINSETRGSSAAYPGFYQLCVTTDVMMNALDMLCRKSM